MFDKKLAEAVRSEIVRTVAEHQIEIQRKAVMNVDNPLLASEISNDRLNEAYAYFANFMDTIRFETACEHTPVQHLPSQDELSRTLLEIARSPQCTLEIEE